MSINALEQAWACVCMHLNIIPARMPSALMLACIYYYSKQASTDVDLMRASGAHASMDTTYTCMHINERMHTDTSIPVRVRRMWRQRLTVQLHTTVGKTPSDLSSHDICHI